MAVQYSFSDLTDLSGAISKAQGQVVTIKGDIRSSAGTLQADWSGSASESWVSVQTRWDNACDALTQALQNLAQTVQRNGSAMAQTESANAGLFGGM